MSHGDTFKFNCPHCGQRIAATVADIGTAGVCPSCTQTFQVPAMVPAVRQEPPPVPKAARQASAAATYPDLPPIDYTKACRVEQQYRSWAALLVLWLIFTPFWLYQSMKGCEHCQQMLDGYSMVLEIDQRQAAASTTDAVRAKETAEDVHRLELLFWLICASTVASGAGWVSTFFLVGMFKRRSPQGPRLLNWLLSCVVALDLLTGLYGKFVPLKLLGAEFNHSLVVGSLVIGGVHLVFLLNLQAFFSQEARLYQEYIRRDPEAFSRQGAVWQHLTPEQQTTRQRLLRARSRRAGQVAWIFALVLGLLVLGAVLMGGLPVGMGWLLAVLVVPLALWIIVESTLLAALFSSAPAVFLLGLVSGGVLSLLIIVSLCSRARKELALAPP